MQGKDLLFGERLKEDSTLLNRLKTKTKAEDSVMHENIRELLE